MSSGATHGREVVGRGRTAEVLTWGDGLVLKLFRPDFPTLAVDGEAQAARAAHAAGLPAPAVHDVVEVDGRRGIVFERVDGPSMQSLLDGGGHVDPFAMARLLGRLHAQLHARSALESLDTVHSLIELQIGRVESCPDHIRRTALSALASLPRGDLLYHGDFHPGNVLLAERGPVIIDWTCGRTGDPAADVARSLLLMSVHEPPHPHEMEGLFRAFRLAYLRGYRSLRPLDRERVRAWRLPLLAARLSEWPPPGEEQQVLRELRSATSPAPAPRPALRP